MFKIIEDLQFVEDVPLQVPDGAAGWRQEVLRTRFRVLPVSDLDAAEADGGAMAVLDRVVVGFEDVVDEGGKPLDGMGQWRARLLDFAFIRIALIRAYYAAQSGVRLGNSAPSAEPGPKAN